MPGGNGTGPMGMGPMTGRAAGYCAGFAAPGYANPAPGRGFGRGMGGGGWGRRNRFYAAGVPQWARFNAAVAPVQTGSEVDALQAQVEQLSATLTTLQERLNALRKDEADS